MAAADFSRSRRQRELCHRLDGHSGEAIRIFFEAGVSSPWLIRCSRYASHEFMPKNDVSQMVEKLGNRYEIMRTKVKKWTVGSPIQAPLDALDNMRKRMKVGPEQVQRVVMRVGAREAAVVYNREIPDICLQHLVAVMLVDKTVTSNRRTALSVCGGLRFYANAPKWNSCRTMRWKLYWRAVRQSWN
jgi:hypothetical protein